MISTLSLFVLAQISAFLVIFIAYGTTASVRLYRAITRDDDDLIAWQNGSQDPKPLSFFEENQPWYVPSPYEIHSIWYGLLFGIGMFDSSKLVADEIDHWKTKTHYFWSGIIIISIIEAVITYRLTSLFTSEPMAEFMAFFIFLFGPQFINLIRGTTKIPTTINVDTGIPVAFFYGFTKAWNMLLKKVNIEMEPSEEDRAIIKRLQFAYGIGQLAGLLSIGGSAVAIYRYVPMEYISAIIPLII